jgi:hypothetical protein
MTFLLSADRSKAVSRYLLLSLVGLIVSSARLDGQVLEARVDALITNPTAVHAGAGFTIPMGTYVRSGIDAALGASNHGISGRIDIVNRFHLDPFREHKWAPYAGGGLTARFDDNRSNRYYLLVFLGVDGPVRKGFGTSVEAGLGGGGRIGIIIRPARAERR